MVYKSHTHYCHACHKTINGSMGVPAHRRGKKHVRNVAQAKLAGKLFYIERF